MEQVTDVKFTACWTRERVRGGRWNYTIRNPPRTAAESMCKCSGVEVQAPWVGICNGVTMRSTTPHQAD
jgi:hypothetical protein